MALPEDLAARLTHAAERAQRDRPAKRACGELESLGPNGRRLADHLRGFLASYDMDAIQRLVGCLPARSAVGVMTMTTEKILIVDDTAANIDLLAGVLEPRGYEILAASNAEQALRIAAKTLPGSDSAGRHPAGSGRVLGLPGAQGQGERRVRFRCSS